MKQSINYPQTTVRQSIELLLSNVDPSQSIMALSITEGIKASRFDQVIEMIVSQAKDNPSCMARVVGPITLQMIINYSLLNH